MKPLEHCEKMVQHNFPKCVVEPADARCGNKYFIARYDRGCRSVLSEILTSRELEAYLMGILQSKKFIEQATYEETD